MFFFPSTGILSVETLMVLNSLYRSKHLRISPTLAKKSKCGVVTCLSAVLQKYVAKMGDFTTFPQQFDTHTQIGVETNHSRQENPKGMQPLNYTFTYSSGAAWCVLKSAPLLVDMVDKVMRIIAINSQRV